MEDSTQTGDLALDNVRVLDLGAMPSSYATRVLRQLGADVIMVEPPGGGPIRREPPFMKLDHTSLSFAHFCLGKRSVCLDLGTRDGCAVFTALCDSADVVVLDHTSPRKSAEGDLRGLLGLRPMIVADFRDLASASQWGNFVGSNLVDEALSGLLTLTGGQGRPPTQFGALQTWHQLSLHGLAAILAAIYGRRNGTLSGELPVFLEVSAQEAAVTSTVQAGNIHAYLWQHEISRRPGSPVERGGSPLLRAIRGPVRCADGFAVFGIPIPGDWRQFLNWLTDRQVDIPESLQHHEFYDTAYRLEHQAEVNEIVAEVGRRWGTEEFCASAQQFGLLAMPVNSPSQVAADHHLQERGAVFEHPLSRVAGYSVYDLGVPFRSTPALAALDVSLSRVGQDTAAVVSSLPGYSSSDLDWLIGCGAIRVG